MNRFNYSLTQTPYRKLLTARAGSYLNWLYREGFEGAVLTDSYREFAVKVKIIREGHPLGNVIIYYSPTKNQFTAVFREIRERTWITQLEEAWSEQSSEQDKMGSWKKTERISWEAYVDGSFHRGKTGYGAVILRDSLPVKELSGQVSPEFSRSRQVGGELFAVYEVIRFCQAHGIRQLVIYYDYYGIEKWATGQWRSNLPMTRDYARFVRQSSVEVQWVKVPGHSGNRWNERADQLAREGCVS